MNDKYIFSISVVGYIMSPKDTRFESPEPVNVTLFGKGIFANVIKPRIL